ncbi:MAG TPA: helix-turn-helix domain-containing protein [Gemmatimonadaceae bacterium]|nr:helix-turn-helix domain-containing protein [Gemmatimonadaceae bacterium]
MGTSLVGYRGVQAELLLALKKHQPLTARELAARFDLTPNAMRRHLETLEAAGIVRHAREVRGVGGPVHAFSLTGSGEALFPRQYATVLLETLECIAAEHGRGGVTDFFRRKWATLAADAAPALHQLPMEERVQLVAELWTSLGYMAEADVDGESGLPVLRKHNCAIRAVAEQYPEICATEAAFIGEVIGVPAERRRHILAGCNTCEYVVGGAQLAPRPTGLATSNAGDRRGDA